ncbi:DUF938 domain-containing protein [Kordiimonas sp. SCSIO 12603]|uniref:DUF938 domain-containing protein n=1 Tax=Kordiimonas sp. SCSIO 12603 TaxID=2829596 RepID=UPI002107AF46|nr:DUF938 domain-containing protein [Kordiimonas sp. SCSIO 12603]UTW58974.1 DUF938 domain-containing protein [Kordiimonas sp. SCSIO 12603]
MASLFNPAEENDVRLHAPATARNRDVILDVLKEHLPAEGTFYEIAAGSGEHALYFSDAFPDVIWHPTDIDESHLNSINAWRAHSGTQNLQEALYFNVLENQFPDKTDAILAINLIHIAPWRVAEILIEKAGNALKTGGTLFLYGPYQQNGAHTSDSNADFDISLKSRNPEWGIRHMEEVTSLAIKNGFDAPAVIPMPANNFSLVFKRK